MTGYIDHKSKVVLKGGLVTIYKLLTTKKTANFRARIRIPGRSGYIFRSLKTTDVNEAVVQVEVVFHDLVEKHKKGLSLKSVSWDKLFKLWYDYKTNNKLNVNTFHIKSQQKNELFFSPYFQYQLELNDVSSLNSNHIENYFVFRKLYWEDRLGPNGQKINSPSYKTITTEVTMLKSILDFAYRRGYVKQFPVVRHPDITRKPNRTERSSGFYTVEDYNKIMKILLWETKNRRTVRDRRASEILRLCVKLIRSSGVRPRELFKLKYKDVQLRIDELNNQYTVIVIRKEVSKNRMYREAIPFDGHNCFSFVSRFREKAIYKDDDDFIFASDQDKNKIRDVPQTYNSFIKRYENHKDENKRLNRFDRNGRRLILRSWRHLYATNALPHVEIGLLAENMGTSVEQLSKTYIKSDNFRSRLSLTSPRFRKQVFNDK